MEWEWSWHWGWGGIVLLGSLLVWTDRKMFWAPTQKSNQFFSAVGSHFEHGPTHPDGDFICSGEL